MPVVARWFFVVLITLAAWLPLQVTVGMAVGFVCRVFDCSLEILFKPMSMLLMATVSLTIAVSIAVPVARKLAMSISQRQRRRDDGDVRVGLQISAH